MSHEDAGPQVGQSDPEFLSIDEVARLTHLAKGTIYQWTSKGRIPYYKYGARLLFRKDEILAHILATRKGGTG